MPSLQEKIDRARRELEAAEREAEQVRRQLQAAQDRVAKGRQLIEELEAEQDRLRRQLEKDRAALDRLTGQLRAAEMKLQRLINTMARLEAIGRPTDHLLPQIEEARALVDGLRQQLRQTSERISESDQRLRTLFSQLAKARQGLEMVQQEVNRLEQELEAASARVATARQQLQALEEEAREENELLEQIGELPDAELPIALLPVRLETRFSPGANERTDLLVRVYPDDIHVDTHEPELTGDELTWGRHFWEQIWRAGGDRAREKSAWAQLAGRFGPERAAWIARALAPHNPERRPDSAVPDDQPLPQTPDFPAPPGRADSWTRAPQTRVLPARWVALGYRAEQRVAMAVGNAIPEELPVGPAPAAPGADDGTAGDDPLLGDEGMRWLVDFAEAERQGMGLRLELPAGEAEEGLDLLLVLGLPAAQDGAAGAGRLAALLEAQHYTAGLAFAPQGTPTNNTQDVQSGYASRDSGYETSYRAERGPALFQPDDGSNGDVTAQALGIDPEILAHVDQANLREQLDAAHMNTALWSATWGYFLEQMMAETFSGEAIRQGREHFIRYVRARGPLPALRVGNQPYGLLPVTSLEQWPAEDRNGIDAEVVAFLRSLRGPWRRAAARLPHVGRSGDASEADEELLHVLGMDATSTGYAGRLVFDHLFYAGSAVLLDRLFETASWLRKPARTALRELGQDWEPRLLRTVLAHHAFPLSQPLVQPGPLSETETLSPNYISWLLEADYRHIQDEIQTENFPEAGSGSLLYLLLRHATLLEYAMAAFRIQRGEGLIRQARPQEPALVDMRDGEQPDTADSDLTIGRYVKQTVDGLRDEPLRNFIHRLGGAEHPQATQLDEFRSSLNHLKDLPSAVLERLLSETLDLCSHRLDAWLTSFATKRLEQLRRQNPTGIYLGGYGWLEHLRPASSRESEGFIHAPSLAHAATAAVLRSGYLSRQDSEEDHPFAIDLSSERVRQARWLLDGVRQGQPLGALLGYRFERGLHERQLDHYIELFRLLAPFGQLYQALAAVEQAKQEVAGLEEELTQAQDRLETTRADRHAARLVMNTLKQEQATLPDRLARAQEEIPQLTGQLRAAEDAVTAIRHTMRKLVQQEKPIDHLIPKLQEAEAKVAELKKALEQAKDKVAELRDRERKLPGEIRAAERQVRDRERKVEAAQDHLHKTRTALRAAKEALREAQEAYQQHLDAQRARFLYPRTTEVEAMESIAARNVVDGLALLRKWRQPGGIPWGERLSLKRIPLPGKGTSDQRALETELRALEQAVDAVGDAVTAESVYQAVQGNPLRAGAALDAITGQDVPPPELEVVRTPRSGTGLTHRIVALFQADAGGTAGWPADERQVRAAAEPRLNDWVASLLGDPARVRCRAEYLAPETGDVLETRDVRLSALGLSPLDALYAAQGQAERQGSELEQWLVYHLIRSRPAHIPADAGVRLSLGRGDDWAVDDLSFAEFLEVARTARQMVTGARALDGRDLMLPEAAAPVNLDTGELKGRANAAAAAFQQAFDDLQELLPDELTGTDTATEDLEAIRSALVRLAYFGLQGAVPRSPAGDTAEAREELLAQARAVAREAARRLTRLQKLGANFDRSAASPEKQRDHDQARLRQLFGPDFQVLSRFQPEHGAELDQAFASSAAVQGGDPLAVVTWFQRIARVREGAARLQASLTYAEILNSGASLSLKVGQLPHQENDRWAALPFPPGEAIAGGRLSLVAHLPQGFDTTAPLAGLLIDEWVEVVPGASETTAMTFHFDQPGARAPQAVLLAVPPHEHERWELDTLEAILLETLDLVRLRAVDPRALSEVDEAHPFLPALYFALNLAGDTVSTDFKRAAKAPDA